MKWKKSNLDRRADEPQIISQASILDGAVTIVIVEDTARTEAVKCKCTRGGRNESWSSDKGGTLPNPAGNVRTNRRRHP